MSQPAVEGMPDVANIYVNRELSWLQFNARVLEEVRDRSNPLLERLRFLTIFCSNLDEFYMVRVSGLRQQVQAGVGVRTIDGRTPQEQLTEIHTTVEPMISDAQELLVKEILPELKALRVSVLQYDQLRKSERSQADLIFARRVAPALTPLAVGFTQPFPFVSNLSLNLGLVVSAPDGESKLSRVKIPIGPNMPRLVPLSGSRSKPPTRLLLLEGLVAANVEVLFPGMNIEAAYQYRVTRSADFDVKEDQADDLMSTLQEELRKRKFGEVVRLEVERGMPAEIREQLLAGFESPEAMVFEIDGPLCIPRLSELLSLDLPELKYPAYAPRSLGKVEGERDLYRIIRKRDMLLHHPFESFDPVVEFIRRAATDPKVVAIKQTLYRTSGDSPIIEALEQAVEAGKQVAAVVELKARFDEENNITWAQRLEEAGVHVIYGVQGLKTHSKLAMVVRREGDELVRYVHIGTGNYNPTTARIYTDLGLFTCDREIGEDVGDVFNTLTGFSRPAGYRRLLVAPDHMKEPLLALIRAEAQAAKAGKLAHIIFKCNSITHAEVINALYDASRAGVRIDLLVRGICQLVPGVAGLSDSISVRSVVGRFLEHHRIYWFHHRGDPRVFIGSADLMERNLDRRVEVLAPILDKRLAEHVRGVMLQRYLDDSARTREMRQDGSYVRLRSGEDDADVHQQFMEDSG